MTKQQQKLVILDRDGVINYDSDAYIKSPEEWIPLPGSLEAIANLTAAGFTLVVATNQSGVARGYFSEQALGAIHQKMTDTIIAAGGRLAGIFYCPHGPEDHCQCRKPRPGLIRQISERLQIETANAPFVGDSLRDIEAAINGGCRPILVKTGNGGKTAKKLTSSDRVYDDLLDFSRHWIG